MSTASTTAKPSASDIETIYRRLLRGLGHELVNDGNVGLLIKRSLQDEHLVLAQELREWRMPCSPGGGFSTIAPMQSFNKERANH